MQRERPEHRQRPERRGPFLSPPRPAPKVDISCHNQQALRNTRLLREYSKLRPSGIRSPPLARPADFGARVRARARTCMTGTTLLFVRHSQRFTWSRATEHPGAHTHAHTECTCLYTCRTPQVHAGARVHAYVRDTPNAGKHVHVVHRHIARLP